MRKENQADSESHSPHFFLKEHFARFTRFYKKALSQELRLLAKALITRFARKAFSQEVEEPLWYQVP